jgi:hypothetical protein
MTGQDGGFRDAVARFSAEVDAAVTRARRAAAEAKAQTAEFRAGTRDLVSQPKQDRNRPQPEDDEPFSGVFDEDRRERFDEDDVKPFDEDEEDGPDGGQPEPDITHASDDDDYFSQQRILVRGSEDPYRPGEA